MFAIIDGLPYLIHDGMAVPIEMKSNGDYTPDITQAFQTEESGRYTYKEILAKCKNLKSIKPKTRKKKEE